MGKRKFAPGDWALIKYGSRKGDYCRISMADRTGGYYVIPYGEGNEPGEVVLLSARAMDRLAPLEITKEELRALARAEKMYGDYKDKVFPPFNIKAAESYPMTAGDIRDALLNIGRGKSALNDFREWFWTVQNVFYDDLVIGDRYNESFFSDSPVNEKEIFNVAFGMAEKLYWKLEERYSQREYMERYIIKFEDPLSWGTGKDPRHVEESGLRAVIDDIVSRVNVFEYNITRPQEKWTYSSSEKRHFISELEGRERLAKASSREIELYREFLEDLYSEGEPQAMRDLAWGYFEGNAALPKDLSRSRKYLEEYFEKTGDPFAANALGIICYYGFANGNVPEYEDAFRYFTYGAMAGIDESDYRAADMLLRGKGTSRNIDMALNMIVSGYRGSLSDFCMGDYENSFPEYALRMGNACRDDYIFGMGMRDAYKFYLEAKLAITMRKSGDRSKKANLEGRIDYEMERIRNRFPLDPSRTTIRTDFPLYLNQLFEDSYPLKITLDVKKKSKTGRLKAARFRFGSDENSILGEIEGAPDSWLNPPGIIVAYPELSYAEMVSEITYRIEEITVAQRQDGGGNRFLADNFRKNEATGALEFYYGMNLVAAIDAKWYVIEVNKGKSGEKRGAGGENEPK